MTTGKTRASQWQLLVNPLVHLYTVCCDDLTFRRISYALLKDPLRQCYYYYWCCCYDDDDDDYDDGDDVVVVAAAAGGGGITC